MPEPSRVHIPIGSDEELYDFITASSGDGGGGGGSTGQAVYNGSNHSVNSLAQAQLSLTSLVSGDALLDISFPPAPSVVEDGVYAVTATVQGESVMTVGSWYWMSLTLGTVVATMDVQATTDDTEPTGSLALTRILTAGDLVLVQVGNRDSAAREFAPISVSVAKLA